MTIKTGYLFDALHVENREVVMKNLQAILNDPRNNIPQDAAIAVRGVSGLLIGPTLAFLTKRPLLVIRKKGDGSHSNLDIEGDVTVKSYIVVDDFTCSGNTVVTIVESMYRAVPEAKFVGVLTYSGRAEYIPTGYLNFVMFGQLLACVEKQRNGQKSGR